MVCVAISWPASCAFCTHSHLLDTLPWAQQLMNLRAERGGAGLHCMHAGLMHDVPA